MNSKLSEASYLRDQIIRLGPWHIDIDVTSTISTRAFLEAPEGAYSSSGRLGPEKVVFINPRQHWGELIAKAYPEGLAGRRFLDCACNCGAYCFWAKECGAAQCFGFDVREHWIKQARFLAKHRQWPSDGIQFAVLDLYDLPKLGLDPFDVTQFKGIFYHLPDPITGLKIAADLTRELIILDTTVRTDLPDGMLAASEESRTQAMSGVYGLNWFPTGPEVLVRILRWLGFSQTRVVSWRKHADRAALGRIQIVASRDEELVAGIDSLRIPGDRA